ncbi:MAG: 30S ribosomal protein S5 [Parcubacteria group bacterium GW2011_GWA2_43_17]|nr:MAG: 30S ribosomal protein S5 [Parcubacteria group bacterium GW2011_GWA2_43_17]KKT92757.1 MAG: 30S ribosomal protein S5 [Parcubacteria group bacterium GW2011_GWF2_45_11]KKT97101.1 MAG: 30S ribosomal protein S5 [Parcubacteria group bacterium GW2011_GWC2_45_15]OGY93348.1 MAG: 30S ribosomal protein S5 [Candidatus Komeilibacteria bacterium RIFOXYC2_FULL_45_12]OGY94919.1 MAG: 30S ribosomal protein S5 [Candidatus Komeilibacteria bacterium RIFOXYA2_FULL_45_9]HAH03945.1 30S ribosomal protein S5 [Ca
MAREGQNKKNSNRKNYKQQPEFEQRILDLARVTRVMAGGKRLRFRATVALGDKKGKVGWGVAKGADVTIAVNKAVNQAKKNMFKVNLVNETIPHEVTVKFKAAKILIKPAVKGRGIIAGGAARTIFELAGVPNIYGKILGRTNNKITNVQAVFKALQSLKYVEQIHDEQSLESDEARSDRDLDREEELEKEQAKLLKKEGVDLDLKRKGKNL